MLGIATIIVLIVAVAGAVVTSRAPELAVSMRRLLSTAGKHLGFELSPKTRPSLTDVHRKSVSELKREVDKARLPDGSYLGGTYTVRYRNEEWMAITGHTSEVRECIIAELLEATSLDIGHLDVALKCDPSATVAVRAVEERLPPRTKRIDHSRPIVITRPDDEQPPQLTPVRLLLVGADDRPVAHLPDDVAISFGRATSCGVVLNDLTVSEYHMTATSRGEDVELMDLGSRNGTYVHGERIGGVARLRPGQTVGLGATILRLIDTGDTASHRHNGGRTSTTSDADGTRSNRDASMPSRFEEPECGDPNSTASSASLAMTLAGDRTIPPRAGSLPEDDRGTEIPTAPISFEELPRPLVTRTDLVVIGWNENGLPVHYAALADPTEAGNAHLVLYGSSGMGKTALLKALAAQIRTRGVSVCILDQTGDFAGLPGMSVSRPWDGMHGNPMCPATNTSAAITRTKVELLEALVTAVASTDARMGHRQLGKLRDAVDAAFAGAAVRGTWPTPTDLHDHLDPDLRGVIGEITGRGLFTGGRPLGDILAMNTVVDVSEVPGTGTLQRQVMGLLLAAIDLRVGLLPHTPGAVNHMLVLDEVNRLAGFRSVDRMLREGRSAGLAVAVASQQPQDVPDIAHTVAGTTVCLRLGARAARVAADSLDASDRSLVDAITQLTAGEAFVGIAGQRPVRVRLAQMHLDADRLVKRRGSMRCPSGLVS